MHRVYAFEAIERAGIVCFRASSFTAVPTIPSTLFGVITTVLVTISITNPIINTNLTVL